MDNISKQLIDRLYMRHKLPLKAYEYLLEHMTAISQTYAAKLAVTWRQKIYGNKVFVRGLIEVSNYCKNDCYYCGIRRSNDNCVRYRLGIKEIIDCANIGYNLGFRTFVLQGGEDPAFSDDVLCEIVSALKATHPDCALTLSLGERSRKSYQAAFDAGADRYLLRHETATADHYRKLHPKSMSLANRLQCLNDLKQIGFVVGSGFMIGSPYQSLANLAADIKFIEELHPQMCGIGPFIPACATPFANERPGTAEQVCFVLSLIRLMHPEILLPATTALNTIDEDGRVKGIMAGANVIMPNLSPASAKEKYLLYDNKVHTGIEAAQSIDKLRKQMRSIGYEIVVDRGDPKPLVV